MPEANPKNLIVGFDVGSTTVKSVVVDATTDQIIWSDYQRHDTKQPEKCLEFLKRMEADAGIKAGESRVFVTGSGGGPGGRPHWRQVRSGSERRFARGREALSRVRFGGGTGRAGRQDHHLQGRPGDRPQKEDPFDERQVRRAARAPSSTRSTPRCGFPRKSFATWATWA